MTQQREGEKDKRKIRKGKRGRGKPEQRGESRGTRHYIEKKRWSKALGADKGRVKRNGGKTSSFDEGREARNKKQESECGRAKNRPEEL